MKRTLCLLLTALLCLSMLTGCAAKGPVPAPAVGSPESFSAKMDASPVPENETDSVPDEEAAPAEASVPDGEPGETSSLWSSLQGLISAGNNAHAAEKPPVDPTDEREGIWDLIPFDEMPYERPNLEEMRAAIDKVGEALDSGADYAAVEALLDKCDELYAAFDTMEAIAFIRSCQDMTDEYYAAEYAWLDEASADVSQLFEKLYFRCGMSDMAQELEEKYFWPGFAEEYADDSNVFYDDEMVALLQTESNLIAEYRDLVANPIVALSNGKEVEFFSAMEEYQGYAYLNLLFSYYEQYNPKLARVYIDLVKNRQAQAAAAGYDSYEELAFDHDFGRDYSPELAEEYLQSIKKSIVPLYHEVVASGALWSVESGPLDAKRLEEVLRCGVSDMGQDVQDAYEFMVKYRLCDLDYSPLKAEMSFQTYLSAYEVPFLFMDAGGTLSDITTFSHEFGHYLDGYLNYGAEETIDLAECYSQAMELLMLTRLDEVLSSEELENLYQIKMLDILNMYVQQAAFAEFEHILYSTDPEELSPEYINQVFLRMCREYGFCEEGLEDLYANFWMDITHFFEQPFYVITYPVSHDIAMQIFQLEEAAPGAGLEKFMEMLPREYPDMLDSALNAGLESPFDSGRIEKVAATMRAILLDDAAKAA